MFKKLLLFTVLLFSFYSTFGQVISNGDEFSVTVPVSNNGPGTEFSARLQVGIPAGVNLVSANPSIGSYSESDSTWYIGLISPGRSQNIKLNFEVTDLGEFPVVISATSSGSASDSDLTNNTFTDTIYKITDLLMGGAESLGFASLRGNVLDNDTLCNFCSTKVYLAAGSAVNGEVVYFNDFTGDYRFVFDDPNETSSFSYDLVCYDCGDGLEYYQNTATEVIPPLFTDSLFSGGGGSGGCCPDTFAQDLIVEEIDTTTKKILIALSNGDTLEAMFTDYRGTSGSGDDWGAQSVQSDVTLTGNGTAGNPLGVDYTGIDTSDSNELQEFLLGGFSNNYGEFRLSDLSGVRDKTIRLLAGDGIDVTTESPTSFPDSSTLNPIRFDVENPFPGFSTVFGDYGENSESTTVTDGNTLDLTLNTFDITGEVILDPSPTNILSSSVSGLLAEGIDTSNTNEAQTLSVSSTSNSVTMSLNAVNGAGGGTKTFQEGTGINLSTSGNLTDIINTSPFPGFTDLDTDYGIDISLYSTLQDLADTAAAIRLDELHAENLIVEELNDTTRQIKIVLNNGDTVQAPISLNTLGDDWGEQVVEIDSTLTGNGTSASPLSVVKSDFYVMNETLTPTGDTLGISGDPSAIISGSGTTLTYEPRVKMTIPRDAVIIDWAVHVDTLIDAAGASQSKVSLLYKSPTGNSFTVMSDVNNNNYKKRLELSGSGYPVQEGGVIGFSVTTGNQYVVGMYVSVTLLDGGTKTNTVIVTNNYSPPPP